MLPGIEVKWVPATQVYYYCAITRLQTQPLHKEFLESLVLFFYNGEKKNSNLTESKYSII